MKVKRKKPKAKRQSQIANAPVREYAGRPQEFSDELIVEVLQKTGGLIYQAAKQIGCDPMTIYKRRKTSEVVRRALKNERGKFVDLAENKLQKKVREENLKAIMFVLRTLGRKRDYIERKEHRLAGDKNAPPIQSQKTITLEQLAALDLLPTEVVEQILEALKIAQEKQAKQIENQSVIEGKCTVNPPEKTEE